MDGGGGVDIHVDPDGLSRLHENLTGVMAGLERLMVPADADGREMGGEDVAAAVDEFVGGWKVGRERLVGRMRDCAEHVAVARAAYSDTECGIVDAMGRPAGPAVTP